MKCHAEHFFHEKAKSTHPSVGVGDYTLTRINVLIGLWELNILSIMGVWSLSNRLILKIIY